MSSTKQMPREARIVLFKRICRPIKEKENKQGPHLELEDEHKAQAAIRRGRLLDEPANARESAVAAHETRPGGLNCRKPGRKRGRARGKVSAARRKEACAKEKRLFGCVLLASGGLRNALEYVSSCASTCDRRGRPPAALRLWPANSRLFPWSARASYGTPRPPRGASP